MKILEFFYVIASAAVGVGLTLWFVFWSSDNLFPKEKPPLIKSNIQLNSVDNMAEVTGSLESKIIIQAQEFRFIPTGIDEFGNKEVVSPDGIKWNLIVENQQLIFTKKVSQ